MLTPTKILRILHMKTSLFENLRKVICFSGGDICEKFKENGVKETEEDYHL